MHTKLLILAASMAALAACVSSGNAPSTYGSATGFQASGSATDWKWNATPDKITGEVSPSISVTTTRVQITGTTSFHAASLALNCFDKKPAVMVVWDFPVGSQGTSFVAFRFDGQSGHQINDAKFYNLKSQIIDNPATVKTFMEEATASDSVLVRVSSTVGIAEATFSTRGGTAAISQFKQSCPPSI